MQLARPDNLILIGLRGAGKTTVGRRAAAILGWVFVDTDERIEAESGCSISSLFASEGEAGFRAIETAVIADTVVGRRQVISVGGGAILADENRIRLRIAGLCVWLTAPPTELFRRLEVDPRSLTQRPPLTDTPGLAEIERLLQARTAAYASVAHHTLDTSGRSVNEIAARLVELLESTQCSP